MRRSKASSEQGFTLIELLITLAVLSFGLLGLAGLQVQMVRANTFSSNMTIANSIGADLLEEARAANWDVATSTIQLFIPSPTDNHYPAVFGDTDDDGVPDMDLNADNTGDDPYNGRFTWTRTLTYGAGNKFVTVDVSVFWTDVRLHQMDFRTVVEAKS